MSCRSRASGFGQATIDDLLSSVMPMNALDVAAGALALACTEDVTSASRLRVRSGGGEANIEGNRAGLLLVACQILALARTGLAGEQFILTRRLSPIPLIRRLCSRWSLVTVTPDSLSSVGRQRLMLSHVPTAVGGCFRLGERA